MFKLYLDWENERVREVEKRDRMMLMNFMSLWFMEFKWNLLKIDFIYRLKTGRKERNDTIMT